MANQPSPLHHLPTRKENSFYIAALFFSPVINFFIHHFIYSHGRLKPEGLLRQILAVSPNLLNGVLLLLVINIVHGALGLHHRHSRKILFVFGLLSFLYLIINLITITYGIVIFQIQSLDLLLVSISVYTSLNIIFVFWYWYFDFPSQLRRLHHPESTPEICFPISSHQGRDWVPNFLDYLYFSVLTSNTLGPPENHSPAGQKAKSVVLLHSVVMLVVLVIFLSRAINTLPSPAA